MITTRDYMSARGPDGAGEWWTPDERVGLGHRRLSIMDLSNRALQPMHSADGSCVVVFNGEIYNYPELRTQLEAKGRVFVTTSDTEILLHLYELEGASMISRLRGMFAFAIWDNQRCGLFLARDLYGIKPLYVSDDGWTFRFASQVKALLAGGGISRDPEPAGIVGFHLWGSVPEPFTLYRDIRSLPAGSTQWVDAAGPRQPVVYESVPGLLMEGAQKPLQRSEIASRVRSEVYESVRAHLLADVEVGVFLSAGVDSGALLGLMRDAGQKKICAITLSFDEFAGTAEDEAPLAAEIAKLYGAEHIIRRVSKAEFESDRSSILEAMDQPTIDGINTWFVAKAAREAGLKVAISGIGGDELLAGYPSFRQIPKWVGLLRLPSMVPGMGVLARRVGFGLGLAQAQTKILSLLEYGGSYEGAYLLRRGLFMPHELKNLLDSELISVGIRRLRPLKLLRTSALRPDPLSAQSRVSSLESVAYMRNQLLRDADWAGMAHSLEIRTPLVDIEVLRALAPVTARLSEGEGKMALAQAPLRPLTEAVSSRLKTGFGVPTSAWTVASTRPATRKGEASRNWARTVYASHAVSKQTA